MTFKTKKILNNYNFEQPTGNTLTLSGNTEIYGQLNINSGQPTFNDGIKFGTSPKASLISGHTEGRMYYDSVYKTITLDTNSNTSLQLGEEEWRYIYNATSNIISSGHAVYETGVHSGTPDTITVDLAIASGETTAFVLGVATQDISPNSYGFITIRGHINNLDTTSGEYSGATAGQVLYLSPFIAGHLTPIIPEAPNLKVIVGRLITKSATIGRINIRINRTYSLGELEDVNAQSPIVDDILKWNGMQWINGGAISVSAGAGITFYNSTPILISRTSPAGISQNGTSGNGIQIASLSKIPITTGSTTVSGQAISDTRAYVAWLYNIVLNRTTIDAGTWEFNTYAGVNSVSGGRITTNTRNIYKVRPLTGNVITSGSGTNTRTATMTTSGFTGTYFSASTTNTIASYLQLPSGIYQISAKADINHVTIIVPTGYVNETGTTSINLWNKLFGATSAAITSISPTYTLVTSLSTQPSFIVSLTDKLGQIGFVNSNNTTTMTVAYNGTTQNTQFKTPLITLHNNLAGLYGDSDYYHLSLSKYNVVNNTSNTNTGDETKSTIESKLTGVITSHTHKPIVFTTGSTSTLIPNVNLYDAYDITGQTQTLNISGVTGTKYNKMSLLFDIKDTGTTKIINWQRSAYVAGGAMLPTGSTGGKQTSAFFMYDYRSGKFKLRWLAQE